MTPSRSYEYKDHGRPVISVVSACLNEKDNLREFYGRVKAALACFPEYTHEIIVADNSSCDGSQTILRDIASNDKHFKVILNSNNFGPLRSGYNAFLKAEGDAVILLSSDLQDPPELIVELIRNWQNGYQVVAAVRSSSSGNRLVAIVRKSYYFILSLISESSSVIRGFTGFGLYDRCFMQAIRRYREPLPYLRGLVGEIGFRRIEIPFNQLARKHGRSKHNFFSLYDVAMSGLVLHSRLPLRIATFTGFIISAISFFIALIYLVYKLVFWQTFSLGLAPIVIGLFFFSAVQLIFIGIVGEYVGSILTYVRRQPLAIEAELINFDEAR
jgi:glycosyltransferase involved in cell wall biosynthesis